MAYHKAAYRIISERFARWYLFLPKSFTLTLEQAAELHHGLQQPTRYKTTEGYAESIKFITELNAITKAKILKEKLNVGNPGSV